MIGNHHIDPGRIQGSHRLPRTRPTVTGDHQRRPRTPRGLNPGTAKIVPVREAIRHKGDHVQGAQPAEHAHQQSRRAHTVNVVVPMHEDRFLRPDGIGDALDGTRKIPERLGDGEVLKTGAEEPLRRLNVGIPARHEQPTDGLREQELLHQAMDVIAGGGRRGHPTGLRPYARRRERREGRTTSAVVEWGMRTRSHTSNVPAERRGMHPKPCNRTPDATSWWCSALWRCRRRGDVIQQTAAPFARLDHRTGRHRQATL